MSFADKVVWITGASSGIGEALAVEFSRYGARVVLSARNEEALEAVRQKLVWPENHLVLPLDVTQPETFQAALERVLAHYSKVDVLVNNSGISQRSLVRDTQLAVDQRVMAVNYFGPIALTKTLMPHFASRSTGRVVVISSLVGELPTPLRSAYCASKHALHGWFESLRAEEYERGLRITMVMPGFVHTNVSVNAVTADGGAHGKMDAYQEQGMSADDCAARVVRAVQQDKEQVIIAGREGLGIYLKRLWPSAYRKIIRRIKVT